MDAGFPDLVIGCVVLALAAATFVAIADADF